MADEAQGGGEEKPARKLPDAQTLLVLLSTLTTLGALGTMVYTKMIYKRPPIVENEEMERQLEQIKKPVVPEDRVVVAFDQLSVNVAMTAGKAHFATVALAVECHDPGVANRVNAQKAIMLDKLISALGKRQLAELNTIQGKLLLKTELLREFNALLGPGSIPDLYFSNFVLQ